MTSLWVWSINEKSGRQQLTDLKRKQVGNRSASFGFSPASVRHFFMMVCLDGMMKTSGYKISLYVFKRLNVSSFFFPFFTLNLHQKIY